jgi:GNAT superfamily N-acetyltransferase
VSEHGTLRPATRDDIPALSELLRDCDLTQREWAGPGVPIPTLEEDALEWEMRFTRAGSWIRVLEEDDGRIVAAVAYAQATIDRDRDRTPVQGLAHVSAVFVHPDRWRRGIARRLLDAAEAAMREDGFDRAQLWTLEGSPAEHLYRALGWVRDGRREEYPPMRLNTVAYVKAL